MEKTTGCKRAWLFQPLGKDCILLACMAFPAAGKDNRPWKNYFRKEKNHILMAGMAFPAAGRTTACSFEWFVQALETLHPQRKEPHLAGLNGFSSDWKRQQVSGLYGSSRPWKNYIRKEKRHIFQRLEKTTGFLV